MSRSVLAERFTVLVGIPLMQYLARGRIQLASTLLSGSSMSLAEIARRVGYGSEGALSRAYKRRVGVAPADPLDLDGSRCCRALERASRGKNDATPARGERAPSRWGACGKGSGGSTGGDVAGLTLASIAGAPLAGRWHRRRGRAREHATLRALRARELDAHGRTERALAFFAGGVTDSGSAGGSTVRADRP